MGGYWSGTEVKISPRLNQISETPNDSSTSRSSVRIESSRRGRMKGSSATRNSRLRGSQIAGPADGPPERALVAAGHRSRPPAARCGPP